MLQFQVQQAPMRFGLAEGVDPHQVPFGTLMTAENVCWTKSGLLEKRPGTTSLTQNISGGGTISAAKRLIVRGPELALTNGETLYTYQSGGWRSRGRHPEVGLTWSVLTDGAAGVKSSDIAYLSNGQVVHAWVTGDPTSGTTTGPHLFYQVFDLETGTVITPPTYIDMTVGWRIRIVASGSSWILLYVQAGNLKSYEGTTISTLKTDVANADPNGKLRQSFDACLIGSEFVVAYALAAGGIGLARYTIAASPALQASGSVTGETEIPWAISIAGASGETLYIGYHDPPNNRIEFAAANPSTLAQTVAPTTVETGGTITDVYIGVVRTSATTCTFVYSFHGTTSEQTCMLRAASITSAGVITTGREGAFLRLLTRPFILNSRVYAAAVTSPRSAMGSMVGVESFLVDVTVVSGETEPFRQVGKIDTLIAGRWGTGYVSDVATVSATRAIFSAPFQSSAANIATGWRQGLRLVEATIGASLPADMWRSISIGPEVCLAAGVLTSYDGLECLGYGWAHAPQVHNDLTTASASGGSMATGTYLYNVVPERRSHAGMLHRGPTGVAISKAVTGPTGSVALSIIPVHLTFPTGSRFGVLPIYRSVANGSVYQRLTIEPLTNVIYNEQSPTPLTLTDTSSDTSVGGTGVGLSTRGALYTSGGELDDMQPPSCLTLAWHQNRVWMVSGDGRTVWFSKDYSSNVGTAPGFHPTMILPFEKTLTALCPMDEKLIAFAEDTFWYVVGVGPAPNGQNGDYQINAVQTDVGCTNPRSVVSTPDGLMFQSTRGIYLLGRGLELSWVGRPVKDQLAAFPSITSAVLVASRNEVRFTCNNAAGTAGIVLVYNYVERQWSTFKYTVGGVYGAPIADAVVWNGVWTFVTTGGVVVQESSATWLDGATWVPLTIETAWVNAGGPLAFQSVRRFTIEGTSNSNHNLTVSVGFDTDTSYPQTKTFAAGSSVTSIGPFEACWITIGTRRKCQAIRFKIQDATPTNPGSYPVGTGRGPSIDMLGIEVGLKKGLAVKNAQHMG